MNKRDKNEGEIILDHRSIAREAKSQRLLRDGTRSTIQDCVGKNVDIVFEGQENNTESMSFDRLRLKKIKVIMIY